MTAYTSYLYYSHTAISRADLWYGGYPIAQNLPVTAGSVSIDSTRATKRTCSLTLVDNTGTLIPKTSSDRLAPYGAEIVLKRGIELNGKDHFWPLGWFRIATADVVDDGSGISIQIVGYDRSRAISLNRLEQAYAIAAGTDVTDAIIELIGRQASGQSVGVQTETTATGTVGALRVIDAESDPWATMQSLATDIGCEIFFNVDGTAVIRDQPNPAQGNVVDSYKYGELSKFTKLTNSLTDDPGYNGVVVFGEAPNAPVYTSEKWDDDPASPTYYLGPYGKRPYFYRSQYIYNQAQADTTAQGLFLQNIGITEQAKFEAIPNFTLDGGDIIEIEYDSVGIKDRYVVQTIDMPLGESDTMKVTCRKRKFG